MLRTNVQFDLQDYLNNRWNKLPASAKIVLYGKDAAAWANPPRELQNLWASQFWRERALQLTKGQKSALKKGYAALESGDHELMQEALDIVLTAFDPEAD